MDKTTNAESLENEKIWHDVLESIKVSVSSANFITWFSQTHLSTLQKVGDRHSAEIGCNSSFVKQHLETRYFGFLQDTLDKTLDANCDITFSVKNPPKTSNGSFSTPLFDKPEEPQVNPKVSREVAAKIGLRPTFTFKNFAVSSTNQMAWAAAEAVAKDLGTAYNPLFIYGGVGVGKTHLMTAVGYSALDKDVDSKIICCTGEQFTNDIVEGIRRKTTQDVRNKYRKLNALLIDDIQFIAGKDTVQEEFFHTFNALVNAGAQIIMTSDKPPVEIDNLEERLKSRFEAGLVVDIGPPDFELRCAIVQIKSIEKNINLEMDIVQLIAGNLQSARQVEGFLVKLISEVRLKNLQITPELVESLLGKGTDIDNNHLIKASPTEMITAVSKYFSLGKRNLLGNSRARIFSQPRQILMYLLRTQLQLPLEEVGRIVSRDHSTVMHAVEKITQSASDDVHIREDIQGIKKMF